MTEAGYTTGRVRREQIIQTATRLFGQMGFNGMTMLQIAQECHISRAGLSHHFPTKESLLEAVFQTRDVKDRDRFRRNGAHSPDGLGILRGMVDLARHNTEVPGLIGLYAVLSAEATDPAHPAHEYFIARYDRIRRGTALALRRAQDAGYLVEGIDPDAAAVEITALMDGLQLQWLLDPIAVDMVSVVYERLQRLVTVPLRVPGDSAPCPESQASRYLPPVPSEGSALGVASIG